MSVSPSRSASPNADVPHGLERLDRVGALGERGTRRRSATAAAERRRSSARTPGDRAERGRLRRRRPAARCRRGGRPGPSSTATVVGVVDRRRRVDGGHAAVLVVRLPRASADRSAGGRSPSASTIPATCAVVEHDDAVGDHRAARRGPRTPSARRRPRPAVRAAAAGWPAPRRCRGPGSGRRRRAAWTSSAVNARVSITRWMLPPDSVSTRRSRAARSTGAWRPASSAYARPHRRPVDAEARVGAAADRRARGARARSGRGRRRRRPGPRARRPRRRRSAAAAGPRPMSSPAMWISPARRAGAGRAPLRAARAGRCPTRRRRRRSRPARTSKVDVLDAPCGRRSLRTDTPLTTSAGLRCRRGSRSAGSGGTLLPTIALDQLVVGQRRRAVAADDHACRRAAP